MTATKPVPFSLGKPNWLTIPTAPPSPALPWLFNHVHGEAMMGYQSSQSVQRLHGPVLDVFSSQAFFPQSGGRGRAQGIVGMAIVLPGSSQWGPMSHMWLVTGQALLEGRKPLWGQYCSASCLSETPTPKNCPSPAVPAALGGPARPDGCFPRPVPSLPSHSWGRTFLPALSCHLTVGTGSV